MKVLHAVVAFFVFTILWALTIAVGAYATMALALAFGPLIVLLAVFFGALSAISYFLLRTKS